MELIPPAVRTLLQRLEVNRAVGFLLLSRGWQYLSGFFTLFLLSSCLDNRTLGVYQLFISLVAMQMFVELGLPGIVALMTSHEWAQLKFDERGRIEGDTAALDRLAGLHRFISRWFVGCAAVFLGGLVVDGYFEIGAKKLKIDWLGPWLALVTVNAAALLYLPKLSILEGCNQVSTINFYRLLQAVTGTLVVWIWLAAGGGLWALVASSVVRWGWEFYLVQVRYRAAFESLNEHRITQPISWFAELWPLSWRIGIQTIGSYFGKAYFTRIVFNIRVLEAGAFGVTWGILGTMQDAALSWLNTRTPEYAMLASRGEHDQLRRRLVKTGLISLVVFLAGAGAFLLAVWGLRYAGVRQAESLLDLPSASLLIVGLALSLLSNVCQISVRLYKRDPFLIPNSVTSVLLAVLAVEGCRRWGSWGVGAAYIATAGGWSLPVSAFLAWRNQRRLAEPVPPVVGREE